MGHIAHCLLTHFREQYRFIAEICDFQHSQTPLHTACASKDESRVLVLLDAGCNVHATDGKGRSPLGVALLNKFYQVVPLLLEYGAGLNDTDRAIIGLPLQQYLDEETMGESIHVTDMRVVT